MCRHVLVSNLNYTLFMHVFVWLCRVLSRLELFSWMSSSLRCPESCLTLWSLLTACIGGKITLLYNIRHNDTITKTLLAITHYTISIFSTRSFIINIRVLGVGMWCFIFIYYISSILVSVALFFCLTFMKLSVMI
jgi:hypothetical protein